MLVNAVPTIHHSFFDNENKLDFFLDLHQLQRSDMEITEMLLDQKQHKMSKYKQNSVESARQRGSNNTTFVF